MIKTCLSCICFLLSLQVVTAQSLQDVIYLKNQNIIRGTILKKNDQLYTIQTVDGSVYNFSLNETDSIKRQKPFRNFAYKIKGFAHFTELGPLIAGKTTINGVTTAAFSFQTVNGYKFNQFAMLGLGVGADLYATQTIIPVFISFRGDLSKAGSVLPFYFAEAGYGVNITQKSADAEQFKGGLSYAGGLGLKIPFNRNAGFCLGFGYRYQKTTYYINNNNTTVLYKRITVRAGFFL